MSTNLEVKFIHFIKEKYSSSFKNDKLSPAG